jgi:hypothetical protein
VVHVEPERLKMVANEREFTAAAHEDAQSFEGGQIVVLGKINFFSGLRGCRTLAQHLKDVASIVPIRHEPVAIPADQLQHGPIPHPSALRVTMR